MKLHPPLIDLLGASWRFQAAIAAAAWSDDGSVAAFALTDGTVALARAEWEGGPTVTPRPTGGLEVHPPTVPSPPVSRVIIHQGGCHALVAELGAGFLSSGADGRVMRIARDGIATEDTEFPHRRASLLACGAAGWRACAAGPEVIVAGRSRHVLSLRADAAALAFDRSGRRLAVVCQDGASIWSGDGAPMRELHCGGRPCTVTFSPDGAWLAVGLEAGGVRAWRLTDAAAFVLGGFSGRSRALSVSADSCPLASSGAPHVLYWRLAPEGLAEPSECGLPSSRAPVSTVAFHPTRPLLVAGYASGAALLCRPGTEDVLLVRNAGAGAVCALSWSPDGERVAFATEAGEAGIVLLPHGLFRDDGADAPRRHPEGVRA